MLSRRWCWTQLLRRPEPCCCSCRKPVNRPDKRLWTDLWLASCLKPSAWSISLWRTAHWTDASSCSGESDQYETFRQAASKKWVVRPVEHIPVTKVYSFKQRKASKVNIWDVASADKWFSRIDHFNSFNTLKIMLYSPITSAVLWGKFSLIIHFNLFLLS